MDVSFSVAASAGDIGNNEVMENGMGCCFINSTISHDNTTSYLVLSRRRGQVPGKV